MDRRFHEHMQHKIHAADIAFLPSTPGSYLLVFELRTPVTFAVGRLGLLNFAPGVWFYAGSAWGPGGLRARLARHFRTDKKPHWHVDALSLRHPPSFAYIEYQPDRAVRLECCWVQTLLTHPNVSAPHVGFGSSDCTEGCSAHLAFSSNVGLDWADLLRNADDGMVR
ncbi:MAG: GIY-YIG nuclease family protein [Caldilineaceae bacterium]|nr:GIY-YIG nuclease family protein [Caldilineaceae bacterium]